MTRVIWNKNGERFYEAGLDRGMLYVNGAAVPWNGLISVKEAPTGGDAKPSYIDGVKFRNRATPEEFNATIEAFTYPKEFGPCEGITAVGLGLYANQQRRKSFDLSYRTKIGNDLLGTDLGYKLHFVYNALAKPASVDRETLDDSTKPFNFSWSITTRPALNKLLQPTAHLVLDSRETPSSLLTELEDIIYGNSTKDPRRITAYELVWRIRQYIAPSYDAGYPDTPSFWTVDGGLPSTVNTSTVDGGAP